MTVLNVDRNLGEQKDSEVLDIIRERTAFQLDPLDIFEQLDEDIIDKFIMETEEEEIVLTYESEEAESEDLAAQLWVVLTMGIDEKTEENIRSAQELGANDLKLKLTMDKSNYLLKNISISMQTKQEDEDIVLAFGYDYSKYNEEMDITPPEESTKEIAEEQTEPKTNSEINEEDAADYLDALIQATIYQDVDSYTKTLPETMQGSSSKDDGELQRDMFKHYYIENTKQNMEGLEIEDEAIEALGEAFIGALGKTKYDRVSTEIVEDRVVVTLSVQGINESKTYEEVGKKMEEIAGNENLEMEELIKKDIELQIEAYHEVDITKPKEVIVNVSSLGEGQYAVPLQDEFLHGGFTQ